MSRFVTPQTAERHEALMLRLGHLVRQVEGVALRRGEASVPESVARLAETALREARGFSRGAAGDSLPLRAPDYAGLAAALGLALAELEAFEARHTSWDPGLTAFVWRLGPEAMLPVGRLRQKAGRPPPTRRESLEAEQRYQELLRRIHARYDAGYAAGLAAGRGEGE